MTVPNASPRADVVALVPLKSLRHAKGRLATTLTATDRRALTVFMFDHVVRQAQAAECVREVVVVAGDEEARAVAARHGVALVDDPGGGLNAAITAADVAVRAAGASACVVLAADLPSASAADVDTLARLGAGGPCVLVAPTADGGTGALLRRPADVIAPAFGPGSAVRHLAAAARVPARAGVLALAGLSHDVDRPDDLRHVRRPDLGVPDGGRRRPAD